MKTDIELIRDECFSHFCRDCKFTGNYYDDCLFKRNPIHYNFDKIEPILVKLRQQEAERDDLRAKDVKKVQSVIEQEKGV